MRRIRLTNDVTHPHVLAVFQHSPRDPRAQAHCAFGENGVRWLWPENVTFNMGMSHTDPYANSPWEYTVHMSNGLIGMVRDIEIDEALRQLGERRVT